MNLVQSLRRLGQTKGFADDFGIAPEQISIVKKLYAKNGLEIVLTTKFAPEQYEIFKDGIRVAYYRLRHGNFRIDCPDCGEVTIFEDCPNGYGMFDKDERIVWLTKAMRLVLQDISNNQ